MDTVIGTIVGIVILLGLVGFIGSLSGGGDSDFDTKDPGDFY